MTLHFIGPVDTRQVPDITASVDVTFQPFELALDQPTLWPHGLAVVCASQVPKQLWSLFDRLGQALRELGLLVETRPYRPHLTLARHAEGAIAPATSAPVVWQVSRYVLVVSTGDRGQRYQVIRQFG